jgi:hypothetical protein
LTEIFKSSNHSIEDAGDTYFPTVEELVFSFRKDRFLEQGLSKKPEPQTVDEPPVEKSGHFGNPDKSTSGRNIEGSQGRRTQYFTLDKQLLTLLRYANRSERP